MINTAFQISEETRKMTKSRISHLPKNKNLSLHSSCVYQQFAAFHDDAAFKERLIYSS